MKFLIRLKKNTSGVIIYKIANYELDFDVTLAFEDELQRKTHNLFLVFSTDKFKYAHFDTKEDYINRLYILERFS